MKPKKFRIDLLFKGLLMGSADIVPGVSGGTVALIVGIYQELIDSIRSIGVATILSPFMLLSAKYRARGIQELKAVNWGFLLPLGAGLIFAVLSLSRVIPQLLEDQPLTMYSLFFGLIVASVLFPWRMVKNRTPEFGLAVAGAVFGFLISGSDTLAAGSLNPLYVFMCGAIAITAMILPGISGSYLLVILGEYTVILEAIHTRDFLTVGIFILGIIVGILSFARFLNWLLNKHLSLTMAALAGLMVGCLRKVWPGNYLSGATASSQEWLIMSCFAVLGFAIVIGLDLWSRRKA